ncbi:MAG TPA: biotin carboxylase N-terminal domain-containing protein [Thermomicrobiales bacterium]|nr:biotin carboxylase N-terminal domain-containing protein [Thermomicrobiales bacterium]
MNRKTRAIRVRVLEMENGMAERTIERVLVANRGEIALRVMRTCREMGIASIAVYGEGEEQAQHVRYADDAWRIPDGPGLPYLRIDALVEIAKKAGADAVHPGYGFLAENASFARAVIDAGLIFIGPPAEAIAAMGDKVEARRIATAAGVRPVPGTTEPVESVDDALAWAAEYGYPVAVKASGGGGGRGFRVAKGPDEMPSAFEGSRGEAERYFSNPEVYLERYIEQPRHIEVQVFVDPGGTAVAFPERECSIQRRHQKLIEETPSTAVDPDLRAQLQESAVALAQAVDYRGVGTLEFLLDTDGSFYFLEMNTRIQVEHTVTEMVTGIDIVREQIRTARSEALSFTQADLEPDGWSIECRINAEDATRNFAPAAGQIARYSAPAGFGVRVDSAMGRGDEVSPTYDSMIAKLVTWARTRDEAIERMARALADYAIEGLPTTIPFHERVMANDAFRAGETWTTFLGLHPDLLGGGAPVETSAGAGEASGEAVSLLVEVGGRRFDVSVSGLPVASASANGRKRNGSVRKPGAPSASKGAAAGGNDLVSPIQGTVLRVAVELGQVVSAGDLVCVVEAMKMENELTAHRDGVVASIGVEAGGAVQIGGVIATIEDAR